LKATASKQLLQSYCFKAIALKATASKQLFSTASNNNSFHLKTD
jgi:hypothetical protein